MNAKLLVGHKFQFLSFRSVRYANAPGVGNLHINDDSHLLHIMQGAATIFIEDRQYELRPGVVVAIPPYTRFYFNIRTPFIMLNIHYRIWLKDGSPAEDSIVLPLLFKPANFSKLLKSLRLMEKQRYEPAPGNLIRAAHAHRIVLEHYANISLTSVRSIAPDARLAPACRRLSDPNCAEYNAIEIARLCGLSVSQLNRLFRKCFGMPPHRFWEKRRFAAACFLLRATDRSVAQIAAECRFDDNAYFSRWFKKNAGDTPAAFRRDTAKI